MTMYLVTQDYDGGSPITWDRLTRLAYDAQTSPEYADYLHFVILKASRTLESLGQSLQDVSFKVQDNGCVLPFGEGGHPYCEIFKS